VGSVGGAQSELVSNSEFGGGGGGGRGKRERGREPRARFLTVQNTSGTVLD
jgi:hypothetical protein